LITARSLKADRNFDKKTKQILSELKVLNRSFFQLNQTRLSILSAEYQLSAKQAGTKELMDENVNSLREFKKRKNSIAAQNDKIIKLSNALALETARANLLQGQMNEARRKDRAREIREMKMENERIFATCKAISPELSLASQAFGAGSRWAIDLKTVTKAVEAIIIVLVTYSSSLIFRNYLEEECGKFQKLLDDSMPPTITDTPPVVIPSQPQTPPLTTDRISTSGEGLTGKEYKGPSDPSGHNQGPISTGAINFGETSSGGTSGSGHSYGPGVKTSTIGAAMGVTLPSKPSGSKPEERPNIILK